MTRLGRLPLQVEARDIMRLIRTALWVKRESDPHLTALSEDRFNNLLRRLQISLDVLCFRLRSRAPRTPEGRIPVCIPRQQRVLQTIRRPFIITLVQRICCQAHPDSRDHLDDLIASAFQDWFVALVPIMLRDR